MTQGLLSRREVLTKTIQVSALATVFLTGCGGFLGGGGSSSQGITGSITVPTGVVDADLSVIGLGKESLVTSGSFHTGIDPNAPSWVVALHKPSGKIVLMGIFDASDHNPKLDATSTAVALLFMALDGSSMPQDGRKPLLDLIKTSPATATFASVIQSLLATDAFALETASSTLQNALVTAASSFHPVAPQSNARNLLTTTLKPQLLLEPSGEVDGLTVVQDSNILGFDVQNSRRRNGIMYTYLVAHVNDTGTRTDIPPQQVGNVLDIPATRSLLNLHSGWHPVTSAPVPLTIQGSDRKSIYEMIAFNPVFGASDPSVFQLGRYAGVVDQWKQDVRNLHASTALSYVAGIIFDAVGISGATYGIAELTATITNLTPISTNLVSLLTGAQDGYALIPLTKSVIDRILAESFLTPNGVKALSPLLQKAEQQVAKDLAVGSANSSVYVLMRSALRIFLAVGAIGLAGDLLALAKDTSTGSRGNLFTATVFQPKVSLNPSSGPYTPGQDLSIQASVPGIAASHLSFHWKLSGSNLANLSDGTNVGVDFTSTKSTVNLGTTPSTVGDVIVSVTVTDTTTSTVIGTVAATYVTGSAQEFTSVLQPFGPNGYHPQGGGNAIVYLPITLTAAQQLVKIHGVNDTLGTITYDIKIPPKSTAIAHTTVVTSDQLFGGTAGIVNGTIYALSYTSTDVVSNSTVWWNYGDEAWLIMAVTTWDNRGAVGGYFGSAGDALNAAKGFAAVEHFSAGPA
jgi:hypothetical protein